MGINGQTCSDTGYYVVFAYPVFNPNFNGDNACANDTANFIDLSTTAIYDNVVEWEWNFGDGSAPSTVQNPSHEFANAGTYDVILFARTDKGCTKLDTNQITIFDENLKANRDLLPILDKMHSDNDNKLSDKLSLTVQQFRVETQGRMIEGIVDCFKKNYSKIMDGEFEYELIDKSSGNDIITVKKMDSGEIYKFMRFDEL